MNVTKAKGNQDSSRRRLLLRMAIAGLGLSVWAAALCMRLYEIQVVQSSDFRAKAEQQQKGFIEIARHRGEILDRRLNPLAVSVPVDSLFAHPHQVEDARQASITLAPLLERPAAELERLLESEKPFVYLARCISPQIAEKVSQLGMQGIFSHPETRRYYPNRELASQLLGFVGTDGAGLSGLEYRYEEHLGGQKARVQVRVDARRRSYHQDEVTARTRGNTLVLHIDQSLQFIAEQVLRETVEAHRARSGTAVIMDPHSGAVLAMASYPDFNPNNYRDYDSEFYRNRAIRETYEPGSTFKIFTLAAVLNEGLVSLGEEINCKAGSLRLASKVYREAGNHDYGVLNFGQVVAKSSNIGTIRLGMRLGEDQLHDYIRLFGFGMKSKVDLPGEEAGLLRPPAQWSRLSIGALSIGQEVGVTALQIVSAISAVANGGEQVQPHVVKQILNSREEPVWQPKLQRRRILRQSTARLMKQALELAVQSGTGSKAALNGYSSAGKTGTAQKIVDGAYSKTLHVPSYVGFAPAEDPVLAAVVVINEPQGEYYASKVAAPAFRRDHGAVLDGPRGASRPSPQAPRAAPTFAVACLRGTSRAPGHLKQGQRSRGPGRTAGTARHYGRACTAPRRFAGRPAGFAASRLQGNELAPSSKPSQPVGAAVASGRQRSGRGATPLRRDGNDAPHVIRGPLFTAGHHRRHPCRISSPKG